MAPPARPGPGWRDQGGCPPGPQGAPGVGPSRAGAGTGPGKDRG
jgi:hypothetical protein